MFLGAPGMSNKGGGRNFVFSCSRCSDQEKKQRLIDVLKFFKVIFKFIFKVIIKLSITY